MFFLTDSFLFLQIKLEEHRESKNPTPEKELPAQPQPSVFPTKATKKTKPSKKILSQTVVYKEKEKAPKSGRKSSEKQEDTNDDLVVTSPTPVAETAESGEEQMPAEGEGTGEEIPVTEQKVEGDNDISTDVKRSDNDVETKPEEGEVAAKEQEKEAKKEKEEKQQKEEKQKREEEVKKLVPKSKLLNNKTVLNK